MKIQIIKKGTSKAGAEICPYFIDVPLPDQKKS